MVFSCDVNREYDGNYGIYSDLDVIAFALAGYTSISGSLVIGHSEYPDLFTEVVTSLNGLSSLKHIGGSLFIRRHDHLKSVNGLQNLESVGEDVIIHSNSIRNLDGLRSLESVGGNIRIGEENITSLQGLANLTSVNGDLSIRSSSFLTGLEGLDNISTINGSLIVSLNDSLESLTALKNLVSIGGNLEINDNEKLSMLGVDDLSLVSGFFSITMNANLLTSDAEALRDQVLSRDGIFGTIMIEGNLDGAYPGPVWKGNYLIENHSDLIALSGYNYVSGDLEIMSASDIADLIGLESLTRVGHSLRIYNNDSLTRLEGLQNMASVGNAYAVYGNIELCTSAAEALRDQILADGGIGGLTQIRENKDCE